MVNVRLKRNFEGVQLNFQSNRTEHSDAQTTLIEGLIGGNFAENRGNAVLALSYDKRDELLAGAREFSNVSLGPDLLPAGSPTTPDGSVAWGANGPTQAALDTVFGRYGVAPNTVRPGQTLGFNQDHTLFSFGSAALAGVDVANYRGDTSDPGFNPKIYSYNFGPINNLQLPLERRQIAAFARYDMLPDAAGFSAEAYSRIMFTTYHSDQQLASTPVTCTGTALGCSIPMTNTTIPADLRELALSRVVTATNPLGPNGPLIGFNKRINEVGPRTQENGYDVVQGLIGFRGDFQLGERDFAWDVYGSWGQAEGTSLQGGNVSRRQLQAALDNPAVYAARGCAMFDPFGPGNLAPACAKAIAIRATNVLVFEQTNFVGSLTGDVFDLPGGIVKFAVGAEYRENSAQFRPDEFLASGDVVGFNAQLPVERRDQRDRAVRRVVDSDPVGQAVRRVHRPRSRLPLLGLQPGRRRRRVQGFARVESDPLAEAARRLQPFDPRAEHLRAVPPGAGELPGGDGSLQRELDVPRGEQSGQGCRSKRCAWRRAFRQGRWPVTASLRPQIKSFVGGNIELKPETADGYSFGIVYQSQSDNEWLSRLNVSADYYKIQVDDVINNLTTSSVIGRCFNQLNSNPTFDPGNQFCQLFTRASNFGVVDVQTHDPQPVVDPWRRCGPEPELGLPDGRARRQRPGLQAAVDAPAVPRAAGNGHRPVHPARGHDQLDDRQRVPGEQGGALDHLVGVGAAGSLQPAVHRGHGRRECRRDSVAVDGRGAVDRRLHLSRPDRALEHQRHARVDRWRAQHRGQGSAGLHDLQRRGHSGEHRPLHV